jgi:hypothetical protein
MLQAIAQPNHKTPAQKTTVYKATYIFGGASSVMAFSYLAIFPLEQIQAKLASLQQ